MLLRSIYHNNQLLRTFDVLLCLLALPFLIPLFLVLAMGNQTDIARSDNL